MPGGRRHGRRSLPNLAQVDVVAVAKQPRRLRVFDPGGTILADLAIPTRLASLRIDGACLVGVPYANTAVPAPLVDVEHYRIVAQLDERIGRLLSARWLAHGQVLTTGTHCYAS